MVFEKRGPEYLIDRNVTFFKRKNDIFREACELSVLFGARVCVFGFTPAGKPFSFGSPSFHAVVNEYLDKGQELEGELTRKNVEPSENGEINKLIKELRCATKEMKVNEKKMEKIGKCSLPIIHDGHGLEELLKVKASLKELQAHIEAASSLLLLEEKPK